MKKSVCSIASIFIILSLLNGCGTSQKIQEVQNQVSSDPIVTETVQNDNLTGESDKNTKVLKDNKADVKYDNLFSRNMKFAFDIFSRLNEEDKDENIFISPLSISTALSMTVQGAGNSTKGGMMRALKYEDMDLNEINKGYKTLFTDLKQGNKGVQIDIGNSIWIRQGGEIKEDFINVNKNVFDAYVTELDFASQGAAEEINGWVAKSTRNMVKKMVDPPIPPDACMYLFNAVYFKGEWTDKFEKKDTFSNVFYSGIGEKKEVMMMTAQRNMEYGEKNDFKVIRLPYGEGKTSMYCVLPAEDVSINSFVERLDVDKWKEIKNSITKRKNVLVNIPRFKLEYGQKTLNKQLTVMGMEEAFTDNADFSGISDGRLKISRVVHKAVVEVNEEGSEAAAVTKVEVWFTSLEENSPEFIADRPFLFFITEDTTDTILFMGKLYDPQE